VAKAVSSRRPESPRDQGTTPFSEILTELCAAAGARCAALVDAEGETVDYSGQGDPFDIRILAAEWRLVLQRLFETKLLGQSQEFVVRARHKSFLVEVLPDGYALVVQLGRRATGASNRALCQARRRLCVEAGFQSDNAGRGDWVRVPVEEESPASRRPRAITIEQEPLDVTVLGRIKAASMGPGEQSYRVRLSNGEERTLVREPFGHWYIEEEHWLL
jgi:hypothetical protein